MNSITPTIINNNITTIDNGFNNFLVTTKDIASSSFAKAALIDMPVYVALGSEDIFYKSSIAFGAYNIRSATNKFLKDGFNISKEDTASNVAVGIVAGSLGGGFKYYVTGQDPIVGMVNNAAYETCNNFKACGESSLVGGIFAIFTETFDSVAQVYLAVTSKNSEDAKNKMLALKAAAFGGFMAGTAIVSSVEAIYLPALELSKYLFSQDEVSITGEGSQFMEGAPEL